VEPLAPRLAADAVRNRGLEPMSARASPPSHRGGRNAVAATQRLTLVLSRRSPERRAERRTWPQTRFASAGPSRRLLVGRDFAAGIPPMRYFPDPRSGQSQIGDFSRSGLPADLER
jgi:hypothetical protein